MGTTFSMMPCPLYEWNPNIQNPMVNRVWDLLLPFLIYVNHASITSKLDLRNSLKLILQHVIESCFISAVGFFMQIEALRQIYRFTRFLLVLHKCPQII